MPRIEPFEKHAARYEAWFDNHEFAYASELRALLTLVPRQGRSVEIGVGTGRFAVPLGIRLGLEPSRAMARVAQTRGLSVVGGVAEALPFRNGSSDVAVMITTICFVDDVRAALTEARRILRPGGSLILGLVDRDSALGRFYEAHRSTNVFYEAATFYSIREITSHLDEAGFRRVAAVQTIFTKPMKMRAIESPAPGWGRGAFVVLHEVKVA